MTKIGADAHLPADRDEVFDDLVDPDHTQAIRAATLALAHAKDQRQQLALLIAEYPALLKHEWFQDIAASLEESTDRLTRY